MERQVVIKGSISPDNLLESMSEIIRAVRPTIWNIAAVFQTQVKIMLIAERKWRSQFVFSPAV